MTTAKPVFSWAVLLIGVVLIAAPFVIGLPGRASAGQEMIDEFHPLMQQSTVTKTADFYDETFVPLRPVADGGVKAAGEVPKLIGALAKQLQLSPAQVQSFLGSQFPASAALLGNLSKLEPVFTDVPAGLDHYLPLVRTMEANVGNYRQIDGLPDFRLFTWFFLVPGVLLLVLGAWPLLSMRHERTHVVAAPAV